MKMINAFIALLAITTGLIPEMQARPEDVGEQSTKTDEQTLIAIEHKFCEAFLKGDSKYIDEVMDPGYVQTNVRGEVSTKAEELAELRRADIDYEQFSASDLKVQLYGDAAVVTGATYIKGTVKASGRVINGTIRMTDTFVRRGNSWRLVAAQTTLLPPAAPPPHL